MKQETFDENFQSVIPENDTDAASEESGNDTLDFYRYRKTFYEKYPELSNT